MVKTRCGFCLVILDLNLCWFRAGRVQDFGAGCACLAVTHRHSPFMSPPSAKKVQMSAATAKRKSAFSCDQCRKRKVKCGAEQPRCARCIARKEACEYKLNPTLSYTENLERRVNELEAHLANAQAKGYVLSPASAAPSPSSTATVDVLPRTAAKRTYSGVTKGLKVDAKGAVTYHGATSFFQLPTSDLSGVPGAQGRGTVNILDEGNQRKEKLVNNAWHQRALEAFQDTPVCNYARPTLPGAYDLFSCVGAFSVLTKYSLVLDPAPVQLCLPSGFYT